MNKIDTPSQPKSERRKCRRLFRDSIGLLVKITIEVKKINHFRDKKIPVFKKKRRKGYKVKNTHRQDFTTIQCISIKKSVSSSKTKKKTSTKPKKNI